MLKALQLLLGKLRQRGLGYLWVTVVVVVADGASKLWAAKLLATAVTIKILPCLNFTLTYNVGAAFGLLNRDSWWPNILFTIITVLVSCIIVWRLWHNSWCLHKVNIALALVLGGALGNLANRLYCHHVIDFIDVYLGAWHWPIFNVADAAISIGTLIISLAILNKEQL